MATARARVMAIVVSYTRCKRYRVTLTRLGYSVQTKAWSIGGPWFNIATEMRLGAAKRLACMAATGRSASPRNARQRRINMNR